MAWNVVIAGGGFAGSSAARELERLLPKQSARLILVNDVNFLLYTPFLPEAAAGTLEPRHVVTPLRDILRRTNLRLGAVTGHDPAARTVELRGPRRRVETLRYDQLLVALGSVSRSLPIPGLDRARDRLQEPRRRDLAAKPRRSRRSSRRTRPRIRRAARSCSPTSSSAAATRASRRSPSSRTSPPTRWTATRGRACTGCAGSWSRRPTGCCPRCRPTSPTTRSRELRGRGIDIRLGTRLEEAAADSALLSTGERVPTRTLVWTAGVKPHPQPRLAVAAARRARPREGRRADAGRGLRRRLGDRRLRRRPHPDGGRAPCPPTARDAVRQGPAVAHNIAAELGVDDRPRNVRATAAASAFVNLGRYKAVGKIGRLKFRGFVAWWMARTYHMSQIPGLARKIRAVVDWTVGLPFRRDTAEVGSIGHPRPLSGRGLRPRRHPPAARLASGDDGWPVAPTR